MRKGFVLFCLLMIIATNIVSVNSQSSEQIDIYFFWAEGCPHCANEKPFLEKLENKYDNIIVHSLEITRNQENAELLKIIADKLGTDVQGVPFTVIGNQYFVGWHSEETTGESIESAVQCAIENGCQNILGNIVTPVTPGSGPNVPETISLPLFGEIETKNVSLPILTIIIAALDGFNPCAMWVLLFLISLLFDMKNKRRMWLFGSVFIIASGFVYFLFMAAWLNLFLFIGIIIWVRVLIGLVALGTGYYNIRSFFKNKANVCKVTGQKKRQKVFERLKKIIQEERIVIALAGLIILAFMVNLVELICSAGLPAIYTQILSLTPMPEWLYYMYLILYVIVFMLDDLFIFVIAMLTLQITGVTSKYTRASHIIGGVIMILIGLLLIFMPELLMFG